MLSIIVVIHLTLMMLRMIWLVATLVILMPLVILVMTNFMLQNVSP